MSRAEARAAVESRVISQVPSDTGTPSDHFVAPELGLLVHYTDTATVAVEAIEFGGAGQPVFMDRELLHQGLRPIIEWLRTVDPEISVGRDGATSTRLGIGFYSPAAAKSAEALIEGVIVFRDGYCG